MGSGDRKRAEKNRQGEVIGEDKKKRKNNQLCLMDLTGQSQKVSKVRGTRKAYLDKGGSLVGGVFRSDNEPSKAGKLRYRDLWQIEAAEVRPKNWTDFVKSLV